MNTVKKTKTVQAPRGMHDILPADWAGWKYLFKKAEPLIEAYGFSRIETPILESVDVFVRGVGEETDIVHKEMYTLKTAGGDEFALKPEGTAAVVRAYLEHGMNVWPQPVKLYYISPLFRHEQPQEGRYRQYHTIGLETIGDDSPVVDAELIFLAHRILETLGLKGFTVQINSIGDSQCRPAYLKALRDYFKTRAKTMCETCNVRIKTNILRVLDCKEESCRAVIKDAPQIMDYLDAECHRHFKGVLEFLDELKVPYILNPHLVRGLDYYTRTVFEFAPDDPSSQQKSIISGGRYDRLVEQLGGARTPASGWGMGIERVLLALKERNITIPDTTAQVKVFIVQLGEVAKRKSLALFEDIRRSGIEVKSSLGRDSLKAQLRIANRLGATYAVIMGQKEALDDTVIMRDMQAGIQETVPLERAVEFLKKNLKK